ncbi:MAG: hypothetical protein ACU84Q_20530 [Gammaproteobacteria bacterium]
MSEFWERAVRDYAKGEIKDGQTRYVLFRTDVIAALVNQLPNDIRHAILESFAKAVNEHGGKSLSRYLEMVDGDIDALLATVEATAPSLGWGAWHFEKTAQKLSLEVDNSPFTHFDAPQDAPSCAPILGMFTALAELVFEQSAVNEVSCTAGGAQACLFVAERVTP